MMGLKTISEYDDEIKKKQRYVKKEVDKNENIEF